MYSIEEIIGILGFLLAFGQLVPTVWNWWRARRSRLQAFPVGKVELSFAGFGNGVSLEGTFRAEDRDFFVHGLTVAVVRQSDRERLDLDWAGVKSRKVVASVHPIRDPILSPLAFDLRRAAAQYYFLVFTDQRTATALSQYLEPLRAEVIDLMRSEKFVPTSEPEIQAASRQFERRILNRLFEKERFNSLSGSMQKLCFWTAGEYRLTMTIRTASPEREFHETWAFSVSDSEAELFSRNAERMIYSSLGHNFSPSSVEVSYGIRNTD